MLTWAGVNLLLPYVDRLTFKNINGRIQISDSRWVDENATAKLNNNGVTYCDRMYDFFIYDNKLYFKVDWEVVFEPPESVEESAHRIGNNQVLAREFEFPIRNMPLNNNGFTSQSNGSDAPCIISAGPLVIWDYPDIKYKGDDGLPEQQDFALVMRKFGGYFLLVLDGMWGLWWWSEISKYIWDLCKENSDELIRMMINGYSSSEIHRYIHELVKNNNPPRHLFDKYDEKRNKIANCWDIKWDACIAMTFIDDEGNLYSYHSWDVRIYVLPKWYWSTRKTLKLETKDHALVEKWKKYDGQLINTNAVNLHTDKNVVSWSVDSHYSGSSFNSKKLESGDTVILFSDGLSEVLSHNLHGSLPWTKTLLRRLEEISSSPEDFVQHLYDLVFHLKNRLRSRQWIDITEFYEIHSSFSLRRNKKDNVRLCNDDNKMIIVYKHP
jgi:hypothetical protein